MSETDTCRAILAPCCQGIGLDLGFGGSAITPYAITFDMPRPYTSVGQDLQIMQGDCRNLSMFCDGALDFCFSSHVLEDWSYNDAIAIIREWRRVLKPGGLLVTNCPDQQRFLAHCEKTGQPGNAAHVEPDWSLATFKERVLAPNGPWETQYEQPEHGPYSWLLVVRKVE